MSAFSSDFLDIKNNAEISAARGGVLQDLGCHAIDLAMWFFGDLTLSSVLSCSINVAGSEDEVNFSVLGEDNLSGAFLISWSKAGYRMPEAVFEVVVHYNERARNTYVH